MIVMYLKIIFIISFEGVFIDQSDAYKIKVSCMTCDIAWLYHDAKMYGYNAYRRLGLEKVVCLEDEMPVIDPSLEVEKFLQNCPGNS